MRFSPVGKRVNAGVDTGGDQIGYSGPAPLHGHQEVIEARTFVARKPGFGNLPGRLVEDFVGEVADEFEPGFEGGQGLDGAVDLVAEVKALERGVLKLPVGAIEDVAVVDHLRHEANFERGFRGGQPVAESGAEEDRLPGIRVGAPFVEDEGTEEIGSVGDFGQERIGDEIVDGLAKRVAGEEGAEVPAGQNRPLIGTEMNGKLRVLAQKAGREFNQAGFRAGYAKIVQHPRRDPFVDQDTTVLRVFKKLNDVVAAVVGFK